MRLALLVFVTCAVLSSACSNGPTVPECDAMLDRYLAMTEDEQRPAAREENIARRRATLAYVSAEKRCSQEISNAELACAMKAPSANDWEACIEY
jgi:hypothetical protein